MAVNMVLQQQKDLFCSAFITSARGVGLID